MKPSITDRPVNALNRLELGHWEMDTVYSGKNSSNTTLLVLTDRAARKEMIFKLPDRMSSSVVKIIDKLEKRFGKKGFRNIFKSITVDNGLEFSDYAGITKGNRTLLFYCHPYSSWERGSNENANKLIRRWIPKGDDIGLYSDKEIKQIEEYINTIPRKIFNGLSANEMYSKLAQTI